MNDVLRILPYGDRDGTPHWNRVSVYSGENFHGRLQSADRVDQQIVKRATG